MLIGDCRIMLRGFAKQNTRLGSISHQVLLECDAPFHCFSIDKRPSNRLEARSLRNNMLE